MSDFCISLISTFLGVLAAAGLGIWISYLSNTSQRRKAASTALTLVQAYLKDFMNSWKTAANLARSNKPSVNKISVEVPSATVFKISQYDSEKGNEVRMFITWMNNYKALSEFIEGAIQQGAAKDSPMWIKFFAKVIDLDNHFTKAYASIKNYTIK